MTKRFGLWIIYIEATPREYPHAAFRIFEKFVDIIIDHRGRITGIIAKHLERVTVVPVQPRHRPDPQKSAAVFKEAFDPVVRDPKFRIQL